MEAVHPQIHYQINKEMKTFSLNIPVISFTHISDENATDEHKLKEYNNNNNNHTEKSRAKTQHTETSVDATPSIDHEHKTEKCLAERLKELKRCINWIHTEIKQMREQDASLIQQFHDIESDIKDIQLVLPSSPFTSCGSVNSLDERHLDRLHLTDQFEYEFRARTSSLLLPHRNKFSSPVLGRKASPIGGQKHSLSNLIRPKSLTHLNTSSEA